MKALVIPSIREQHLNEFFAAWRDFGDWDVVIVIEGNGSRTFRLDCPWDLEHVSFGEIERRLHDKHWIISRGDSACRCYGFLLAAELGAEWILNLDDDCLPVQGVEICGAHLSGMRLDRTLSTVSSLRVRGLPYRNRGEIEAQLSMGLWRNVPDVDGPQGLLKQPYFEPPLQRQLANPLLRYPICGMHLFFHVSLIPSLYFPLMGNGQPYRRFDDIWAGWIFQRIAQHLQIPWSFGGPCIEHVRASDPFRNLIAEAPGIEVNETFWERVNSIELTAGDVPGAAREIAASLQTDRGQYLKSLGHALAVWVDLAEAALANGAKCCVAG